MNDINMIEFSTTRRAVAWLCASYTSLWAHRLPLENAGILFFLSHLIRPNDLGLTLQFLALF